MPENLEVDKKVTTFAHVNETSRDGAEVARWAHNPKVVGSNPAPATKGGSPFGGSLIFYMLGIGMCADSSVVAYLRHAGCWGMSSPGACCCARASATLAGMRSDSLDAPCAIPRQTGVCCRHAYRAVSRLICRFAAMGGFSVGAYANRAESAAFAALRPVLGFKLALSYFAFASTSGAMSL